LSYYAFSIWLLLLSIHKQLISTKKPYDFLLLRDLISFSGLFPSRHWSLKTNVQLFWKLLFGVYFSKKDFAAISRKNVHIILFSIHFYHFKKSLRSSPFFFVAVALPVVMFHHIKSESSPKKDFKVNKL
jgi:hypothetical protein